jgi:hypothetical protein
MCFWSSWTSVNEQDCWANATFGNNDWYVSVANRRRGSKLFTLSSITFGTSTKWASNDIINLACLSSVLPTHKVYCSAWCTMIKSFITFYSMLHLPYDFLPSFGSRESQDKKSDLHIGLYNLVSVPSSILSKILVCVSMSIKTQYNTRVVRIQRTQSENMCRPTTYLWTPHSCWKRENEINYSVHFSIPLPGS